MFEKRNKWIKTRFGNIDEKILGRIEEVKEISPSGIANLSGIIILRK